MSNTNHLADWRTITQAADDLHTSPRSIQRMIAAGELHATERPRPRRRPETVIHPDDIARAHAAAHPPHVVPPERDAQQNQALTLAAIAAAERIAAALWAVASTGPHQLTPPEHARPLWMSIADACEYSGLSAANIRAAIASGQVARIGRRIKRADIEAL